MPKAAHSSASSLMQAAFQEQDSVFRAAFEVLQQGIGQRAFPGCSVAICLEHKLIALKGLGRFAYDQGSPVVQAETIYDLASVSKVLATTAMAMLLYERGQLDLEAPVTAILPEFSTDDPRRADVTVRMLLAHSSGLPAYERLFERARTRNDLLRAATSTPLAHDPGSYAEYSDIGFIILVEIL